MTLFYDTQSLFIRASTKILRNPILLMVSLLTPLLFLLLFSQLLQKLTSLPGAYWQLSDILDSRNIGNECCHRFVPVRHVNCKRCKPRISPENAPDPDQQTGNPAWSVSNRPTGGDSPIHNNNRHCINTRASYLFRSSRSFTYFPRHYHFRFSLVRPDVMGRFDN